MRVFIVGVTGDTGIRLARLLKARGDEVSGLYRRPAQGARLAEIGVVGFRGDLVEIDAKGLAGGLKGCEIIVFSAGATDNEKMIDAVDGEGVIKSMAAAAFAGVRRFILVSVFPEAGRHEDFGDSFERYIEVKKRAEIALSRSDLDWVILRPSTLDNSRGVGSVSLGPAELHTRVFRDDVAATIAELIHTPALRHKILELTGGTMPIAHAVARQVAS